MRSGWGQGFGSRLAIAWLAVAVLILGASFARNTPGAGEAAAPASDQVLVKFKATASARGIEDLKKAQRTTEVGSIDALGVKVHKVPAGKSASTVAAAYRKNANVQFAEVDVVQQVFDTVPNDPQFSLNQWGVKKVQAPAAWDITTGAESVLVAVLDTGVWAEHPDLAGKTIKGFNFVAGNDQPADDHGHGTGVAGIAAAATNNATGMAGMSWGSMIMPVKVCDSGGSCLSSNVARGITWAADHGARVVNMSLGGQGSCGSTYQAAVDYAWNSGAVIVAASGNDSSSSVSSPANCNNVVAVGATDSTDTRTSWSNYGSALDVVAPGATILLPSLSGGYAAGTGTSFASPIAAGSLSLLLSKGATNTAAVTALKAGADDLGAAGWDSYYGSGRVNVFRALQSFSGAPAPSATATPTPSPTLTATPVPTSTPPPTATPSPTSTPQPALPADGTAPSVTLVSPADGQTVKGTVSVSASASDNVRVTKVEFYVDGKLLRRLTGAPYTVAWNTKKASKGTHTVTVKAYDSAGNVGGDSHKVTVTR